MARDTLLALRTAICCHRSSTCELHWQKFFEAAAAFERQTILVTVILAAVGHAKESQAKPARRMASET